MSSEFLDYSTVEKRTDNGLRLLSIYANSAEGLITVSRLTVVLSGEESSQASLVAVVNALVSGQQSEEARLEVLTLSQLLDKVESYCSKLGGIGVFGTVLESAPEELVHALEASDFYLGPAMDMSEFLGQEG